MTDTMIQMVGIAVPTLRELRAAVMSGSDPDAAVGSLREAGYAGGDAVYAAFERWLAETSGDDNGEPFDTGALSLSEFGDRTAKFFRDAGWGTVNFSGDENEGVAIVDVEDCWEGPVAGDTGCQITTGLLAAFFGRVAGYPVAVLETECCSGSSGRCRFLLGNADVMAAKWEELSGNSGTASAGKAI